MGQNFVGLFLLKQKSAPTFIFTTLQGSQMDKNLWMETAQTMYGGEKCDALFMTGLWPNSGGMNGVEEEPCAVTCTEMCVKTNFQRPRDRESTVQLRTESAGPLKLHNISTQHCAHEQQPQCTTQRVNQGQFTPSHTATLCCIVGKEKSNPALFDLFSGFSNGSYWNLIKTM